MSGELQSVADAIGVACTTLDQLPEPIKRNLWKAAGALITGLAEVPAAYLEMKAAEFKIRKRGHELVNLAAAQNAARMAGHSPELANRAVAYFAHNLVGEQANREAVLREAGAAVAQLPPPDPAASLSPIDDDWLDHFRRIAATKSNQDIQAILGRILAGEIHKPGSFSPVTLEAIARLTQNTAKMLEDAINYSIIIPGHNDFIIFKVQSDTPGIDVDILNFQALILLQSYGFLTSVGTIQVGTAYLQKLPPCTLGGQRVVFSERTPESGPMLIRVIQANPGNIAFLSPAAMEIAHLIAKKFDLQYARNLRLGLRRVGVEISFPDIDIDADDPDLEHNQA